MKIEPKGDKENKVDFEIPSDLITNNINDGDEFFIQKKEEENRMKKYRDISMM